MSLIPIKGLIFIVGRSSHYVNRILEAIDGYTHQFIDFIIGPRFYLNGSQTGQIAKVKPPVG
jgi:hypothetical protein